MASSIVPFGTGPYDPNGDLTNATIVNGVAQSGTFSNYKADVRNHMYSNKDRLLSLGLVILLSLVSYHIQDPSLDTAATARPLNLLGYPGSYLADLAFQTFGLRLFHVEAVARARIGRELRPQLVQLAAFADALPEMANAVQQALARTGR